MIILKLKRLAHNLQRKLQFEQKVRANTRLDKESPVVREHPSLGQLTFDRVLNWYSCKQSWEGFPVKLQLSVDQSDDPAFEAKAEAACALLDRQREWYPQILECAIRDLL